VLGNLARGAVQVGPDSGDVMPEIERIEFEESAQVKRATIGMDSGQIHLEVKDGNDGSAYLAVLLGSLHYGPD
jgi:hypothetical protein